MSEKKSITILHLSDIQFGANHRFGVDVKTEDGSIKTLLGRLTDDLKDMKDDYGLTPELIVLTGDLVERGTRKEYDDFCTFLDGVIDFTKLTRGKVALVPGNHDINRSFCEAYFLECKGNEEKTIEPYWRKWKSYKEFFDNFYKDFPGITFTKEKPWTLFVFEDLELVVAGLNSTIKESHRDNDHYGWCGENQYRWFDDQLKEYIKRGWFRIAAVHHNVRRNATEDDANLRDEKDLKRYLKESLNLILHGHVHDADMDWLTNVCPILATGSAALKPEELPSEIPNQYQIIQIEKNKISRWCRAYSNKKKKWMGDNLPVDGGNDWKQSQEATFKKVFSTFGTDKEDKKESDATLQSDSNMDDEIKDYRQKAEALHSTLPVAGFVTHLKVSIDIEDIFVPLRAMLDLRGFDDERFLSSEHAEKCLKRNDAGVEISLLEALRQSERRGQKHLVILGDPGSGKTTHLKRLLLWCLRKGPESLALPSGMLPVFLPLRELENIDRSLDVFIEEQLDSRHYKTPKGFGKGLLKRGNLLFLLDGLDEVADLSQREQVAKWIVEALPVYSNCRFVVTCRFAGYSPTVRLNKGFLEMHVRPLTGDQVERFVHNWYRVVEKGLAKDPELAEGIAAEKADNLIKRLQEPDFRTSRVFELTRNPLLLTNICLVHRHRGELPRKRARLYEECIDVLLEHWREAKGLKVGVTARDGCRALQPAAYWLHSKEGRTQATAEELKPHIEPVLKAVDWKDGTTEDFLRTIRDDSGLLTGWDQENYGFMHLGFQEYLAAREIRSRAFEDETVLRELALHFGESWWQEVGLLMLALEDPSLFKSYMREVVKLPAFIKHTSLVEACLTDAAEKSAQPFFELLEIYPGNDKELWERQLYALKIAERLDPGAIEGIKQKLAHHPSLDIRKWITGKKEQALLDIITAERGGYELIRIPGGVFMMGSPESEEGRDDDEGPLHRVTVPDFYMGRYPVTNEEYDLYLQENPDSREPAYWANRQFNQPRQPVVGVSWDDVKKYAKWAGLRLPTEAEWEYACRANTETRYYFGNKEEDLNRAGWYIRNSGDGLHPVGEKEPNSFGLYDMHGNVWEWVEDDIHDNYNGGPNDGSAWIDSPRGSYRVMRGGGWFSDARLCRSAIRFNLSPDDRSSLLGFRLSRSVTLGP